MTASHDKRKAAASSIAASLFLTLAKLAVGLATGSLGILSEAAHSLLDLGAALLTYMAVKVADQPADANHPFGHGKVEAVSALIETGLLFVTAFWIVFEAVSHILAPEPPRVEATWYGVAVILVSIAVDIGRSRALMRVAKATRSQALEADALHFSTDIASSAVVLAGLGAVALGYPKGDAWAALGVALFVLKVGYSMGRRTIDVLVDAAPQGIAEIATLAARTVPGVARVERVRARPSGGSVFVELQIRVSRGMALERVQIVRDAVADAVRASLPEANPLVLAEPLAQDSETVADVVRARAAQRGLMVHDIATHVVEGRVHVSLDLELDANLPIRSAHAIASGLEAAIRDELGQDVAVVTHLDPRRPDPVAGQAIEGPEADAIRAEILSLALSLPMLGDIHDIVLQRTEGGLVASMHCLVAPGLSVGAVHEATQALEWRLMAARGDVARAVVHAEPAGFA